MLSTVLPPFECPQFVVERLDQWRQVPHDRVEHDRVFDAVVAMNDPIAQRHRQRQFRNSLAQARLLAQGPPARLAEDLQLPLDGGATSTSPP